MDTPAGGETEINKNIMSEISSFVRKIDHTDNGDHTSRVKSASHHTTQLIHDRDLRHPALSVNTTEKFEVDAQYQMEKAPGKTAPVITTCRQTPTIVVSDDSDGRPVKKAKSTKGLRTKHTGSTGPRRKGKLARLVEVMPVEIMFQVPISFYNPLGQFC